MKRTYIKDISDCLGKKVKISGWINSRRDHGKLIFIELRDRTGILQIILKSENMPFAREIKQEWIVSVEGEIKDRPKGATNSEIKTGEMEMVAQKLEIISRSPEEQLADLSKKDLNLKLNTLFDNRPFTLRHTKSKAIFKVFKTVLKAYRTKMEEMEFFEIKTPKIIGTASEGGANFFTLDYFGKKAYLAQSPQFYKQMGVGIFERVFEIGPVFRKEPHFTTRHMNEYISLDAEMGFILSFEDVMDEIEKTIKFILKKIIEENKEELKMFDIETIKVKNKIPRIKLCEMRKIIKEKYKYEIPKETDIDPEGEKLAGKYALEKFDSDLIFLTNYPVKNRPFYTMPSKDNPKETESFDLLFRGLEIATGGQRIHKVDQLLANIEKWKLDPKIFKSYLQAFEYGMPPHGGWGMGCERIVYKTLNLSTVKKASLFPRDVKRLIP